MTSKCCADCIHMAPWPERLRQYGRMAEAAPFYPLYACMVHPTKVLAVSPSDGAYCTYFERGSRSKWVREIKKEMVGHDR